ncbi:MAG TPA: serine/threonine-protein kinase [Myxococcota bacterium]|nr:serine/threonine-protein kinase [Myxococcota bacterium]
MSEDSSQTIGRYQLLARLASGGMAEIFLARQTGIGGFEKLVVVKRILPNLAREKAFVEMFLDEAVIAAQLNHPNVVQIYDLGQAGDDYYIAMEYLEGESLGHLAREGAGARKPLSPGLVAGIVAQVCDGLHYAHSFEDDNGKPLNIVHRDISPHNVIVLFSGMVKVVDFGIAKAATKMHQTQVGTLKGKLAYMSPEQCMGSGVDARSDIFSLGVVLWELLTSRRLFKRDVEPAMIRAIVDEPIPKVRDARIGVPEKLAAIADRALEKDPEKRFQSAAEMAAALRQYLRDESIDAQAEQISAYAHDVLGERARTKKKLLEEIREKGADSVSLGVLKPKSDSLPSQSMAGQGASGKLAEAATRIRTEGDDVGTGAGGPRSSLLGLQVVIGVLVLGLATLGFFWWRASKPVQPAVFPPATHKKITPVEETGSGQQKPVEPEVQVSKPATPAKAQKPSSPVTSHKPAIKQAAVAKRPKAKTGWLTFDTKPWTEVYLGKRKLGITPLLKIDLPAGRHELTLVNQGRGIHQKIKVTITAGELATVRKVLGK